MTKIIQSLVSVKSKQSDYTHILSCAHMIRTNISDLYSNKHFVKNFQNVFKKTLFLSPNLPVIAAIRKLNRCGNKQKKLKEYLCIQLPGLQITPNFTLSNNPLIKEDLQMRNLGSPEKK